MNLPRISAFALAASVFISLQSARAVDDVAIWQAGSAKPQEGGYVIPDKKGGFDLVAQTSTGITIGEKPSVGDDTKSVEFDGTQTNAFRTRSSFPGVYGTLRISAAVKPSAAVAEQDGTVFRYGTQWELRYVAAKASFSLVVWHEDKTTYTQVSVQAKPDEWQLVEGVVANGSMSLSVGTEKKDAVLKGSIYPEQSTVALVLGASRANLESGGVSPRPFVGAVADMRIGVE